ncbi:MAG: glutamate carboxypeptidase [Flavobacteriaceae bacterium]|nr:glutamate carboxypeptidase [Flavobacteriaceae bacterium]
MKKCLFLLSMLSLSAAAQTGFTASDWKNQLATEELFTNLIDETRFKIHLKELTKKPHVAGSKANNDVIDYIAKSMSNGGLSVKKYPYDIYMSKAPGESYLEIVQPKRQPLSMKEDIVEGDPFSSDEDLWKGWNAYSGSGEVTAEVVYANYGRKEDFEKLQDMGIDVSGKIVIARYGGNFRGYKAKFAEAAGASGLIIFTDPMDSGYFKGLGYPEGPYYSESTIQRGSLLTEDFTGDPLTPYEPALPLDGDIKIKRKKPEDTQLHSIPVTPIGYGAAKEILGQMNGDVVPSGWQGGLPFTYRLQGGSDLKVFLKVNQPREFVRVHNVIGTVKGSVYPDEWIILGCHLDAWGFGATDPNSGTAMLISLSETLGKLVKEGKGPKRSILIGHWDAEEHGVIGSAEWVEEMRDELNAKAVAYMNFDGGVSGKRFGASSSPSLKELVLATAKEVDYPYSELSLYDQWRGAKEAPSIGNLGGGSDHIGFYMHVGVPSMSGGAGGTTVYHSNYDSFRYYERFVDPEFQMGATIEKFAGIMSLRLANATLIPYDLNRYPNDLTMHFDRAEEKVRELKSGFEGFEKTRQAINDLSKVATSATENLSNRLNDINLSAVEIQFLNRQLIALEKSFIDQKGMYYGDWFKSIYASSDPFSGYASWILPGIEYELAIQRTKKLKEWDNRYAKAIADLAEKMRKMSAN